jgi:PIN domain nuclease of toxin-antitoxin system
LRLLIDTHLLIWSLLDPSRLLPATRHRIETGEVFVSAASVWELSIKAARGRIACDPAQVADAIEPLGFRHLPVTAMHAAAVACLPALHRDPFDRMLVAQAISEQIPLLTRDTKLTAYGKFVELA